MTDLNASVALSQMSIWYRRAWSRTIKVTVAGLICALLTGSVKRPIISLALTVGLLMAAGQDAVIKAAARYVPGFNWHAKSIVSGAFTCGGHKQTAILGTTKSETVVAVFLNGMNKRPEVIHDGSRRHQPP
jgi:hypothetical protein